MQNVDTECYYHDWKADENTQAKDMLWRCLVVALALCSFGVALLCAAMLSPVRSPEAFVAEPLSGTIFPHTCTVGSDRACLAGGCPLLDSYMLRVEPCPSNFSVDPVWGGSHITMSSQEHPYKHSEAIAKWNDLMTKLPPKLLFAPAESDWNSKGNVCHSEYGLPLRCSMLLKSNYGYPWMTLREMGRSIDEAKFLNARLAGFHITIADHNPQSCERVSDRVPSIARHFASGSWVLVLLHIDKDGTMYRVKQRPFEPDD